MVGLVWDYKIFFKIVVVYFVRNDVNVSVVKMCMVNYFILGSVVGCVNYICEKSEVW